MKIFLVGSTLALTVLSSFSAYAWGQREQDMLKGLAAGIGAVVLHNHAAKNRIKQEDSERIIYRNPERRAPSGINNGRAYLDCYDNPYCHNPRLARAYNMGREKRRMEVERQLAKEAYERGYQDY